MRSRSAKSGTLRIESPPFVHIAVLDDDLRAVAVPPPTEGWVVIAVPPGTYEISFRAADAAHTELVELVGAGAACDVMAPAALEFSSSAPFVDTATTHDDQRASAAQLATASTRVGTGPASLFMFVRDARAGIDVPRRAPNPELMIVLEHGRELGLRGEDARRDDGGLWAGIHVGVEAGFARLVIGERGKRKSYEQGLVLIAGYQTQIFARVAPTARGASAIEPGALSIMVCPIASGFDPMSTVQRTTALALRALEHGAWVSGLDRGKMLGPDLEESALLGIVGVHLLMQGDPTERDVSASTDALLRLHTKLGPLPDIVALRLAIRLKTHRDPMEGEPLAPLDSLPMLYKSWKRWVQASQDEPLLIRQGSMGDRIGLHAMSSGPWLAWRSGVLERDAGSVRRLENTRAKIEAHVRSWQSSEPPSSDVLYRALCIPRVTAERATSKVLTLLDDAESAVRARAKSNHSDDVMIESPKMFGVGARDSVPPAIPSSTAPRPLFPPRRLALGTLFAGSGFSAVAMMAWMMMAGPGSIIASAEPATVTLVGTFNNHEVLVDGQPVIVRTDHRLELEPGEHTITVAGIEHRISVHGGEDTSVVVRSALVAEPPDAGPVAIDAYAPVRQDRLCIGHWQGRLGESPISLEVLPPTDDDCARLAIGLNNHYVATCRSDGRAMVLTASGRSFPLSCSGHGATLGIDGAEVALTPAGPGPVLVAVNLDSTPRGARVYLDSLRDLLGTTPLSDVGISRGRHTIIFQLAGFEEARLGVVVGRRAETFRSALRPFATLDK